MKKIFTLMAALTLAASVNAQTISFGTEAQKGSDLQTTWSNGDVKLVLTNADGKMSVDANKANFGTADKFNTFVSRLKTGGKSSTKRFITLTVPADGKVRVAARTGKNSENTRTVVLTQDGVQLVSKALDEAEKIVVNAETTVYPYVEVPVKAGTIEITFPVNGINIYGIEFIKSDPAGVRTVQAVKKVNNNEPVYNLAGQQVSKHQKGLVIVNGKKIIRK